MQGQRAADIPGLFNTEQSNANVDWSSDNAANEAAQQESNMAQGQNMILLGGKSLLTDLTMEKGSLDQAYVHSHRLLDNGEASFLINAHPHCLLPAFSARNWEGQAWCRRFIKPQQVRPKYEAN